MGESLWELGMPSDGIGPRQFPSWLSVLSCTPGSQGISHGEGLDGFLSPDEKKTTIADPALVWGCWRDQGKSFCSPSDGAGSRMFSSPLAVMQTLWVCGAVDIPWLMGGR